jgi:uncharacterized protein YkwD
MTQAASANPSSQRFGFRPAAWSLTAWGGVVLVLGLLFFAGMWAEYKLLENLNLLASESSTSNEVGGHLSSQERDSKAFADAVVSETNRMRTDAGLRPLIRAARLDTSAGAKLDHALRHDYWSHNAPDGTSPWAFMTLSGYTHQIAGENLARDYATAKGVVEGWMNSPSHRENILAPGYTDVGVTAEFREGAFVGRDLGWMVVAHYASSR